MNRGRGVPKTLWIILPLLVLGVASLAAAFVIDPLPDSMLILRNTTTTRTLELATMLDQDKAYAKEFKGLTKGLFYLDQWSDLDSKESYRLLTKGVGGVLKSRTGDAGVISDVEDLLDDLNGRAKSIADDAEGDASGLPEGKIRDKIGKTIEKGQTTRLKALSYSTGGNFPDDPVGQRKAYAKYLKTMVKAILTFEKARQLLPE